MDYKRVALQLFDELSDIYAYDVCKHIDLCKHYTTVANKWEQEIMKYINSIDKTENYNEDEAKEYRNEPNVDLTTVVKPGDTMEVKVLKVNDGEGQVLLTYKRLAADRGNKRIEEAYNNKEVLTAKVVQVLDGGLSVVVEEVRIFIPASLVSDSYEKDLTKYAGQEIQACRYYDCNNYDSQQIIEDAKRLHIDIEYEKTPVFVNNFNLNMDDFFDMGEVITPKSFMDKIAVIDVEKI